MTNRPKQIGTSAETAVVRHVVELGCTDAHRRVLAGSNDVGDVWVSAPDGTLLVLQVKAGRAAEVASVEQKAKWYGQAAEQAARAGINTRPVLVTKRAARGDKRVGDWRATWAMGDMLVESSLRDWLALWGITPDALEVAP